MLFICQVHVYLYHLLSSIVFYYTTLVLRVPLIIWNGGVKGSTDKLVTLRDIPATICDVFGVEHKFLSNNNLLKYKGEEYIYSECSYNPLRGPIYVGDEEKYKDNVSFGKLV